MPEPADNLGPRGIGARQLFVIQDPTYRVSTDEFAAVYPPRTPPWPPTSLTSTKEACKSCSVHVIAHLAFLERSSSAPNSKWQSNDESDQKRFR